MKVFLMVMSLFLPLCWSVLSPVWADDQKPGGNGQWSELERRRQSATEELMSMLKETMGILRNLDRKPSADEKKHLAEMIARLDVMLKQQQETMQDLRDQQENIRQQEDEFFRRQRILEQQQKELPQQ